MSSWTIVTGEYPPQPGGVSDYVRNVAGHLAATGDQVTVWAPQRKNSSNDGKVVVGPLGLPPTFRASDGLRKQLRSLPRDTRLLLQYSPHGFGLKGMNIPLARAFARLRDLPIDVMFHEVAYPYRREGGFRYRVLANAQRYMARTVAERADRIFVAALAWKPLLETIVQRPLHVEWLPVPSNLPLDIPESDVKSLRSDLGYSNAFLFGHFGTYGESITRYLSHSVPRLLNTPNERHCLLLGRGAAVFRSVLVEADSGLASRIHARENLKRLDLARHLIACDAMIQPFPDGVSGRRTSLMASIALGIPTITTCGPFSEPIWHTSNGVATSSLEIEDFLRVTQSVLNSPEQLRQLSVNGLALYRHYFAVEHTIDKLRANLRDPLATA